MSAALRHLTAAVLSDERIRKSIIYILLAFLIFAVMPVSAVCEFFSEGEAAENFFESIADNMPKEQKLEYQKMENMFSDIESVFDEKNLSEYTEKAKAVYLVFLYGKEDEKDFVSKLMSCFSKNSDAKSLAKALEKSFDISISEDELNSLLLSVSLKTINTAGYIDPDTKNSHDLVLWARRAKDAGWGYVFGTYGEVLTSREYNMKLRQYPKEIGKYSERITEKYLGKRTADCVGLIKGYLWLNPKTKDIQYGYGGFSDLSADGMFEKAGEKGKIATIPEIAGLAVWKKGHIGIYIGKGKVIEAFNTEMGILETRLSEGGWTHWIKIPGVAYE